MHIHRDIYFSRNGPTIHSTWFTQILDRCDLSLTSQHNYSNTGVLERFTNSNYLSEYCFIVFLTWDFIFLWHALPIDYIWTLKFFISHSSGWLCLYFWLDYFIFFFFKKVNLIVKWVKEKNGSNLCFKNRKDYPGSKKSAFLRAIWVWVVVERWFN